MSQDVLLWVGSGVASVIGCLVLLWLRQVLGKLDDAKKELAGLNDKFAKQGESFARMETSVEHLTRDVRDLISWRQKVTEEALQEAREHARALEAKLRSGT